MQSGRWAGSHAPMSKRSGGPGLRSGFLAGDAALIRRNQQLVNYGGVAVPYPILAASTALWQDEAHVEAGRERYRANFDLAEAKLGNRFGWRRPDGGFFLWLEVGDGEAAARQLWARAGLKVLPGGYMARPDGAVGNPGERYIRVALVQAHPLRDRAAPKNCSPNALPAARSMTTNIETA